MTQDEVDKFLETDPERFAYDPSVDIVYHLWTRTDSENSQIIDPNNPETLKNSRFNKAHPTRVLTHGWGSDVEGGEIQRPKREFLKKGDYNVIAADWSKGAKTINYITARYRVKETGAAIGRFIEFLVREGGANLNDVQPTGYSLGGHVVGHIGKALNGALQSIVALDPAGPLFDLDDPSGRTDFTDAKYVEVIHTSAGIIGFSRAIGTADFYPNGGKRNPGCESDPSGSCDHPFAVYFYAESINSGKGFWGRECTNDTVTAEGCAEFKTGQKVLGGEPVTPISTRSVYWLKTNLEEPWARGQEA